MDLGGPSIVYSLNYEYRFIELFSVRIGASVVPIQKVFSHGLPILSASGQFILFEGNHHLEIGVGFMGALIGDDDALFFVPLTGYRYQKPEGGFLLRLMATPLFRCNNLSDVLPWGGISLGYSW